MDELKAEPPEGATPALPAPPDGGYGWILVMACFLTQAFTFGYQTSFGPFQRYFVTNQTFGPGTTNVQIAFVSSLCSAITFIVGPFTAAVIAKIGFRATAITGSLLLALGLELASLANAVWQLYLSYSLIGGIGIALAYIPSTSVVPQWFGKRMGLAMGIAIAGGGIGGLILAPVSQALMDAYDWRMAYRVGGAIAGGVGSLAGLLIKARLPPAKRTGSLLQQYDFHRFKDFTFTRLYLSIMMASLSFFVPYVFVPLYAGSIGIPPTTASVIIGLMNALNAVGRIVMGFVADYFGAMNTWLLNIWLCTMSILLIWTNASTLGLLIFFAVWFGFTGGAFTSLYPLNAAKIWGAQGAAALMGVLFTSLIPGGLLGAVLGGAILDSTTTVAPDGSKQYHFLGLQLYTGFMIMISALILLWVRLERGNTIGKEGVIKGLKLLI
ncbi:major facilitator superfamily domain-containing protein [Hyaloraphidium curvatum]|nr:major facilitator superfamily domain-containing protein [Hyaloraphidium curvatum]